MSHTNKKKACFSTWCTDDYVERVGLKKLQNSLKYFHPDVPHYVYTTEDVTRARETYSDFTDLHQCMIPVQPIERKLIEKYDIVIHIDADSTVTGSLDEILEGDYEVACVRNNSDHGTAGCHPGESIYDPYLKNVIQWQDFVNAGLIASTKADFWTDWFGANKLNAKNHAGHEQDVLNCMLNSGRYKAKLLDPLGSNVSYGVSNAWGPFTPREHNVIRHWDSWTGAFMKDEKLYIPNIHGTPVEVKVLHVAGGCNAPHMKQDHKQYGFSDEVLKYIDKVTADS